MIGMEPAVGVEAEGIGDRAAGPELVRSAKALRVS